MAPLPAAEADPWQCPPVFIADAPAEHLSSDQRLSGFWPYFQKLEETFWKLECRQSFSEPKNPSRQALARGKELR
ncbi:hypothetical protein [Streptosporangium sp. NPDC048865]|uniref:hypothetical protein n=1 Tax=Streptosporangium sp. NPDC048865 TaxID=3155766 RepID=UPI003440A3CB